MVACKICVKDIPHSVAKSYKRAEYVYCFCRDTCFAQRVTEAETDIEPERGHRP